VVEFVFKSFVANFVVSFVEIHRQEPACSIETLVLST